MSQTAPTEVQTVSVQTAVDLREIRDELRQLTVLLTRASSRHPILLYSLRHPYLRLVEPLSASLEYDGEQVIAYAPDLDLFGYGDTESEALDDLRRTVTDLYYTLQGERESLGPMPAQVWDYLAHIIIEAEP
ncbi:MAG: hypothetical protein KAX24_09625 [Anaerolineae bacterium]|nr:hypothetical protein [Anaerolineae bacterium]